MGLKNDYSLVKDHNADGGLVFASICLVALIRGFLD